MLLKHQTKAKPPWWERITDVYMGLLLCLPLWVTQGGYGTIEQDKFQYFFWLTGVYCIILCVAPLQMKLIGEKLTLPTLWLGFPQCLALAYFMCCVVSAVASPWGMATVLGAGQGDGLVQIGLYVLVFLLVSQFAQAKWWLLVPVVVTVMGNGVLAYLQYAGYNPLTLYPMGYTYQDAYVRYSGAFMGTLGNTNFFSAYLAMAVAALVVAVLIWSKPLAILVPLLMGAFTLVLCHVSAGIVGLLGALAFMMPWLLTSWHRIHRGLLAAAAMTLGAGCAGWLLTEQTLVLLCTMVVTLLLVSVSRICPKEENSWCHPKKVRWLLYGLICGAGGLVLVTIYWLPITSGTLWELQQVLHGTISAEFGSSRILLWQEVGKLVPEHWMLGGGPGTLALRSDYVFSRYIPEINYTATSYIDTAHNDYLNILVNTGLGSLLTYLALLWTLWNPKKIHLKRDGRLVVQLAVLAYLVQICFSFTNSAVTPLFWMCLGLMIQTARKENVKPN